MPKLTARLGAVASGRWVGPVAYLLAFTAALTGMVVAVAFRSLPIALISIASGLGTLVAYASVSVVTRAVRGARDTLLAGPKRGMQSTRQPQSPGSVPPAPWYDLDSWAIGRGLKSADAVSAAMNARAFVARRDAAPQPARAFPQVTAVVTIESAEAARHVVREFECGALRPFGRLLLALTAEVAPTDATALVADLSTRWVTVINNRDSARPARSYMETPFGYAVAYSHRIAPVDSSDLSVQLYNAERLLCPVAVGGAAAGGEWVARPLQGTLMPAYSVPGYLRSPGGLGLVRMIGRPG